MHSLKTAQQLSRQRHLAPVLYANLQRPDPEGARVQVNVEGTKRQDLADPGTGMGDREHEGLVDRCLHVRSSFNETRPLVGSQVLLAAFVNELERPLDPPVSTTGRIRP